VVEAQAVPWLEHLAFGAVASPAVCPLGLAQCDFLMMAIVLTSNHD